jgi:Undecaprenyl-phosphate glucose phosphotransferase
MYSFDHTRRVPAFPGTAIRSRLPDIGLLAVAAFAAKYWIGASPHPGLDHALIALSILLALIVFPIVGLYGDRTPLSDAWLSLAGLVVVQGVALAVVYALDRECDAVPYWVIGWFALSVAGFAALRAVRRWLRGRAARRYAMRQAIALVGQGERCIELANLSARQPVASFRVAAVFVTSEPSKIDAGEAEVHRDLARFVECVRSAGIGEIWIVLPLAEAGSVGGFVRAFRNDLVDIRFMPDLNGVAPFEQRSADLAHVPALDLVGRPLSAQALIGKAIFDRIFACLALIATAPLMTAIAVAVKLSSSGPVLFRQRRMGAYGRPFTIYKFRTMRGHGATSAGELRQATRGDPRVTRVGALLRRTSLDELPQFFNVLKGDMSVVGPRPHAMEHDIVYQDLVDGYIHRYRIKPGITGWAQVNGLRGETDRVEKMQRRVEHDLYYLQNWSLALDVRIVFATVFHSKAHRNAY